MGGLGPKMDLGDGVRGSFWDTILREMNHEPRPRGSQRCNKTWTAVRRCICVRSGSLSCGDNVYVQTPCEQRIKKEVIHDFFFCGVSARLRRVKV